MWYEWYWGGRTLHKTIKNTCTLVELPSYPSCNKLLAVPMPRAWGQWVFWWMRHFDTQFIWFNIPYPEFWTILWSTGNQVCTVRTPCNVCYSIWVAFQSFTMTTSQCILQSKDTNYQSVTSFISTVHVWGSRVLCVLNPIQKYPHVFANHCNIFNSFIKYVEVYRLSLARTLTGTRWQPIEYLRHHHLWV